jgi:hypothetical protein
VRLAGWPRSPRPRCRGASCRSPSGRKSRSCTPAGAASARSRGVPPGQRQRSPENCAGMQRPGPSAAMRRSVCASTGWRNVSSRRGSRPWPPKKISRPSVCTPSWDHRSGTSARTARSTQSSFGLECWRRSTATSWRSTSSSASFDAEDRASSATHPRSANYARFGTPQASAASAACTWSPTAPLVVLRGLTTWQRLKTCANPDCRWGFYDRS